MSKASFHCKQHAHFWIKSTVGAKNSIKRYFSTKQDRWLNFWLLFLCLSTAQVSRCSKTQSCQTATHAPTHSSRSLNDRWGIQDDPATTFLHSSLSSTFRRASSNPYPVRSDILSSHLFFCLPFLLPSCTVPCRIIFASPVDLVMCPYHLNLRFLTVVIRSSYGQ